MGHKPRLGIRWYFVFYVFVILCVTVGGAAGLTWLLNRFITESLVLPVFFWIILLSIVIGGSITTFLSSKVLAPLTSLRKAMSRVAGGDFSVRLEQKSRISEINDIYADFNLMARELSVTETLQSDFVSNVSHEIKTPINAIEGYAMLLQDKQLSAEERAEYVDKILFNTRRLSGLVGNILLLSKVENQAILPELREYRLDEQIRCAILALEPKWTEKEIEFDVELEPVTYCGSEPLMLHVWSNLIDNAIKYSPQGGMVHIRLTAGQDLEFQIQDEGIGIPKDKQAHIFDKFYQADGSHKSEGNGLGLALVRRILDLCGGNIRIESGPGKGSCFIVSLPENR